MSKRTGKVIGPDDGFAVPLWGDAEPAQGAMFAAGVGIGPEAPRAAEVACAACGAVCGGSCGAMAQELPFTPGGIQWDATDEERARNTIAAWKGHYREVGQYHLLDDTYVFTYRVAEKMGRAHWELSDAERAHVEWLMTEVG